MYLVINWRIDLALGSYDISIYLCFERLQLLSNVWLKVNNLYIHIWNKKLDNINIATYIYTFSFRGYQRPLHHPCGTCGTKCWIQQYIYIYIYIYIYTGQFVGYMVQYDHDSSSCMWQWGGRYRTDSPQPLLALMKHCTRDKLKCLFQVEIQMLYWIFLQWKIGGLSIKKCFTHNMHVKGKDKKFSVVSNQDLFPA